LITLHGVIFSYGLRALVSPSFPQAALPHDRPKRRVQERVKAEYLCSRDVARILPFSTRKICEMAAKGTLPAFKVDGCTSWCFSETAIRAKIAIQFNALGSREVIGA